MNAVLGNEGERTLALQCMADGLPRFWQNYRFHAKRKFEIDLAWPDQKVGIEIDGGIFNGKAHGSVTGILRDLEKHNLLLLSGWRVLRYTPAQVRQGEAIEGLKQLLRSAS
jgi:very-short-patch-repair endonuclease